MSNHYDLVIIGGGPGGLTAAIYGGRAKLKTLVINKGSMGGMAANTREIANWPGTLNISGPDLIKTFESHAKAFGAEFLKDTVIEVDFSKEDKFIKTKKNKEFYAKAVIIACGSEPRFLGIPGEKEFMGNGVAYCATCDAESFEGEDVVVVGSGDQAIEEGMYITKFAKKVKVIVLHDEGLLDCNRLSAEKALCHAGMEFIWNSTVQEIKGHENVECVRTKNLKTGECSDLPCQGVFMFVGMVPATKFLEGSGLRMEKGYIAVNDLMETNIQGVYAIGDNRIKYLRQIVTSAGDGATAAVAAERYIGELNDFNTCVLGSHERVLLLFFSAKDNASLEFGTLLEKAITEQGETYKVVKVDVATRKTLAEKYGIQKVPAVLVLEQGSCVGKLECTKDKENLVAQLTGYQVPVN
jgi:thioredoxin reductase (NADPH)